MKTSTRQLFLSAAIALFFVLTLAALAQEQPPAPAPTPSTAAEKSTPAASAPASTEPATPAASAADSTATPPPAATDQPAPSKLRRLDVPATPAPDTSKPATRHRYRSHRDSGNELVQVGSNAFLPKGQSADAVVSVFGNATAEGDVADSVVSVFGNTRATGNVGEAAVAVFGNTYVNGKVGDAVVAVFGTVELGPDADVNDVVSVGGNVKRDPKSVIHGELHNVGFGEIFANMDWLHSWFDNCVLHFRLLAFAPHLMWAWWIALGFLGLYVVFALLFGKNVNRCVDTLEERPGSSILAALLTVLLTPIVIILLVFTGVGIAIVPFVVAALFIAGLFGKAVMLAWLGRRITRLAGVDHPALAVLVGGVIVLFLYTIPVLGVVIYKLFGWIGLGVVVSTLLAGIRRERPPTPPASPVPPAPIVPPTVDPVTGALVVAPLAVPPMVATTLPRAGFWIRLAALLIDVILLGVPLAVFGGSGKGEALALAIYGACMWKLRGTTIGGIVCGLKVVRLDDRPLDWATAVVRALGCFLSLAVFGLGFIWVAFDDQRQSWHDKIAGTTVVRVPKGVSLV